RGGPAGRTAATSGAAEIADPELDPAAEAAHVVRELGERRDSRWCAGSIVMKSLSRKLQNVAVWPGPICSFMQKVLLAMITGWPQASVAPEPAPVTLQAVIAIMELPVPLGESYMLEM